MDWTGGVRKRFAAGKNNATIQKQKAHFAKARAALQHTPTSNRQFKPAFRRQIRSATDHTPGPKSSLYRHRGERPASPLSHKPITLPSHHGRQSALASDAYQGKSVKQDAARPATSSSARNGASSCRSGPAGVTAERPRANSLRPSPRSVDEEQRLLMANKHRLLAQSDWLGLSAMRPVQIKFNSRQEKDRIGKRRRIVRATSQKGHAATRRVLTPLFGQQLNPHHLRMSGALQSDEIHVRVGTEALASQTQRSRHDQTSRAPASGTPSTELGPLSEEPMLLGDEGDMYEAAPARDQVADRVLQTQDRSASLSADRLSPMTAAQLAPIADTELLRSLPDAHDNCSLPSEEWQSHGIARERRMSRSMAEEAYALASVRVPSADKPSLTERSRSGSEISRCRLSVERPSQDGVNEELFWRRLMGLEEHTARNFSVAAVKSSSFHVTASDSSHRPRLSRVHNDLSEGDHHPSTPRGAGTHVTEPTREGRSGQYSQASPTDSQSQSHTLKQKLRLAERTTPALEQRLQYENEDAAWREFIVGSEASSESSLGQARHVTSHSNDAFMAQTGDSDLEFVDLSGLGTSVKSTHGGTQHAVLHSSQDPAPTVPGLPTLQFRGPNDTLSSEEHASSPPLVNVDAVDDDIEEFSMAAPPTPKGAVPVRSWILNPRRFVRSAKRH